MRYETNSNIEIESGLETITFPFQIANSSGNFCVVVVAAILVRRHGSCRSYIMGSGVIGNEEVLLDYDEDEMKIVLDREEEEDDDEEMGEFDEAIILDATPPDEDKASPLLSGILSIFRAGQ